MNRPRSLGGKYYENGSHADFILYMTDPTQQEADINALRQAFK